MSLSSSPLMESFPPTRFSSPVPSPTMTETDLPMDVDQSFNSSMSITDDSPGFSPTPCGVRPSFMGQSLSGGTSGMMMPIPTLDFTLKPRRPDPVPIQLSSKNLFENSSSSSSSMTTTTMTKRTFGRELSLNTQRPAAPVTLRATKSMLPPPLPEGKPPKSRAALPMQWTLSGETKPRLTAPMMFRRETEPLVSPRSSSFSPSMSMDSPAPRPFRDLIAQSPSGSASGSNTGSPGLGSFFCDSPVAPSPLPPAKRRSTINESPDSPSDSPSAKRASLGVKKNPERAVSSNMMLFGNARANSLASRRGGGPLYPKRPLLSAVQAVQSSIDSTDPSNATSSAYPILYAPPVSGGAGTFPRAAAAPMRRAFSVCDQPHMADMSEEESELEASPCVTATQAEYARRHGVKVAPRVDGSPGFKPTRSSIAITGQNATALTRSKKMSPYGPHGMPRFGDNEMDEKILPCHTVKEDGLVRIKADTLDDLLAGKYDSKIKRYHVLDCRFDYEFEGGHVEGAINVKSMDALDELLLSEFKGVHANGEVLPQPSRSGELPDGEQVVLVFHCEFSAKRAPTFAKHLRSQDRTRNSASYPRIFYPEIYILEGGYSGFYRSRPARCDPCGYTPMDDPKHFERRNSDLHNFRNFGRTKSFTYGETTGPSCPPLAYAAASAATSRRGHGATIKEEEQDGDSSWELDTDSPSNRIQSMSQAPIFGSAKTRTLGRMGFQRVASYAGQAAR